MNFFFLHPGIFQVAALVVMALVLYPSIRILHRMGYSGWWVLILLIPFGGFVALWILAFSRWPALEGKAS
jgi:uncharacterized membrane protein YhaH (DUF805 family)